jgi:hypothetical protein
MSRLYSTPKHYKLKTLDHIGSNGVFFFDFFVLSFFHCYFLECFSWLVGTKAHSPAWPLSVKFVN